MNKIGKVFLYGILLLLVYIVGSLAFRIWFSPEIENAHHLKEKAKYLESVADLPKSEPRPNVVFILFDDMGYGDLGAFGSQSIHTPNIDAVAGQGIKLTQYYSPAPNCTPSRAATLTGRLPIHTTLSSVVFQRNSLIDLWMRASGQSTRLPTDEIVLPEILKSAGYATKMIGKWHLGDLEPSLPNNFGFDDFYGLLYSNDMAPLDLYHNKDVIEPHPIEQETLTEKYTDEAVAFIETHKTQPFFLYFAHSFPHIPLHTRAERQGKSDGGLYGDVVEELDDSVGRVVAALKENGVADNTLVIISSDNGPWFQGNPGNHRGRKQDTFDGGMAVPFIAFWPGKIPAGATSNVIASGLDILPTILDVLDLPLPADRQLDGISMQALLLEGKPFGRETLFYNNTNTLYGVRDARFKYQAERPYFIGGPELSSIGLYREMGPWLFDLQQDPTESYDVSIRYPAEFKQMQQILESKAADLKKNPRGWIDTGP